MTRKVMLEAAGHTVTTARDFREVMAACESRIFAVAILGQTLSFNEKLKMSQALREKCSGLRILELYTTEPPALRHGTARLEVSATEPEELVTAVNSLVAKGDKGSDKGERPVKE
jgi:hypothetical protein